MGGATYCDECYSDLGWIEGDFDLHLRRRLTEGRCVCCEGEIVAGEYIE